MIAIILAAGSGKRLQINKPKGMLNIGNQPLIKYSLDCLTRSQLIDKIYMVTGFYGSKYDQYLKNLESEVPIVTVHNPKFENSGSLYSLYLALKELKSANENDDIVILDSDILYDFDQFLSFLSYANDNCIMATNVPDGRYDACYVEIDDKGLLKKISKNINYVVPEQEIYWEHIGIVKSSAASLAHLRQYCETVFEANDTLNHDYDYAFESVPHDYKVVKYLDYLWSEVDDNTQLDYMISNVYPKLNIY
jgi:choline kinase